MRTRGKDGAREGKRMRMNKICSVIAWGLEKGFRCKKNLLLFQRIWGQFLALQKVGTVAHAHDPSKVEV